MFSKSVVGSDNFLDLPVSSRELYFQLGIYADDDGFITPKSTMRMVGATDDDLKVLIGKGFVLPFQSGVIVIRDWKKNNYIQSDRYTPTIYQKEYLLACEDPVYKLDTQVRLGKVRLVEKSIISPKLKPYFRGNEMRYSQNKWWVLENGEWLEFAGDKKDMEYK